MVAASIAVISLAGCSSTSSYKMPGSSWLSWGKKKPADTSLASKKRSELPAPPSSTATPNTPPTYAQTPNAGSPQTRTAWNSTGMPAAGAYGQGSGASYSNASYGGGANTAQGFYSPDYQQAGSTAGNSAAYSGGYNTASAANAAGPSYGSYPSTAGSNTQPASASTASQWNTGAAPQYRAPNASYSAPPAGSAYGSTGGYGQTSAPAPTGSYSTPNTGYPNSAPSYGYQGSQSYPDTNAGSAYAQPSTGMTASQIDTTAGAYRPGSTARTTPFGSSDSLQTADAAGIQPASFSGSGGQAAPAPAPGGYQTMPAAPQTATGGGSTYNYPSTYR